MHTPITTTTPLTLLTPNALTLRPHHFHSPITFLTRHTPTLRRHPTLITVRFSSPSDHDLSWSSQNDLPFNGWAVHPHSPVTPKKKANPGLSRFLVAGVGTVVVALVGVLVHFSISKYGLRLPFRNSSPVAIEATDVKSSDLSVLVSDGQNVVSGTSKVESPQEVAVSTMMSENHEAEVAEKGQPRLVSVSVDSNQREALSVLKKLKIIEEGVEADNLCTRRDYARWLIQASSMLERNPKHKLTSAAAVSGSVISAYDDINVEDQDFTSIQALAEAGIVLSKLSSNYKLHDGSSYFFPERFINRLDLIDWRAQLEYDYAMRRNQEMLKTKLGLMDLREVNSHKWPGLLMDMLAGDKSLLRRVFGQIRRLQPNKPSIVAQAALALTGGRMAEAIQAELLRREAEESSRLVAKEEIKLELLDRGEIKRSWDEKLEKEKARALDVQQLYIDAQTELADEVVVQEAVSNAHLKEEAAIDCQKQLLNSLEEEVKQMSEKIASERAEQVAEEEAARSARFDLERKQEGILDAKSCLDAEIEALRILRSWIEDEAKKCQARSKVLEDVGRRWKWDRQ